MDSPEPIPAYRAALGDLRAEDRHVFLFALKPLGLASGAGLDTIIALTYDLPEAAARRTQRVSLSAEYTADAKQARDGRDEAILLYGEVSDALDRIQEAVAGFDVERYRQIRERYDDLYKQARQHALAARDQELLNRAFMLEHFMHELSEAAELGLLHGHEEARRSLKKDFHYRRYLMEHHRYAPSGEPGHRPKP